MDSSLQSVSQGSTHYTGGAVAVEPGFAICLKKVKKVLLKSKKLASDDLNIEISEVLADIDGYPEVDTLSEAIDIEFNEIDKLYHEHVISKINSCDGRKMILDINDHIVYESTFVNSVKPEGEMNSAVLDAKCSLWKAQYQDRIFLNQQSVVSTLFHETNVILVL